MRKMEKMVFVTLGFLLPQAVCADDQIEKALAFNFLEIEIPRENILHGEASCNGPTIMLYIDHKKPFGFFDRFDGQCWDPPHGIIYDAKLDLRDGTVSFIGFEQSNEWNEEKPHGRLIRYNGKLRGNEICGVLVSMDMDGDSQAAKWPEANAKCVWAKVIEAQSVESREDFLLRHEQSLRYGLWWKDAPDGKEPELFNEQH